MKPPTKKQIEAERRANEMHAEVLFAAMREQGTSEIAVNVTDDFGKIKQMTTMSEPWKLGHGDWVVKLDGFSGGYDCSRVTVVP